MSIDFDQCLVIRYDDIFYGSMYCNVHKAWMVNAVMVWLLILWLLILDFDLKSNSQSINSQPRTELTVQDVNDSHMYKL